MTPAIGGLPVLELAASAGAASTQPRLTRALVAPGRAMMLLQLWAEIPGLGEIELIASPPMAEAADRLNDRTSTFPGNTAFAFGGAVLAPFANRVRGRLNGDEIETLVGDTNVRLQANGGSGRPGDERYAIHGLILDEPVSALKIGPDQAFGAAFLGQDGHWPSELEIAIDWRLTASRLTLIVTARNIGAQPAPVGLGWHPYFNLPSGRRDQARLHIPSTRRALVNDYAAVLPTGLIEDVTGTAWDFSDPSGRALGALYLDDCYLDLWRNSPGVVVARISDPASGLGLDVGSRSGHVTALQVYAPPDKAFVVVEPQFNLADPFGEVWNGRPTGMVWLEPQASVIYDAWIALA
jgi:aldose 1-epimerase